MEEKRKKNTEQPLVFMKADLEKLPCRDCVFRRREPAGSRTGAERSECDCYPGCKPIEVLYYGAQCEYYVGDNDNK